MEGDKVIICPNCGSETTEPLVRCEGYDSEGVKCQKVLCHACNYGTDRTHKAGKNYCCTCLKIALYQI